MTKNGMGSLGAGSAEGVSDALDKARQAAAKLKKKDSALYWATVAQTLALREIRDELRAIRVTQTHSVTLPDDAPPREAAKVTVRER